MLTVWFCSWRNQSDQSSEPLPIRCSFEFLSGGSMFGFSALSSTSRFSSHRPTGKSIAKCARFDRIMGATPLIPPPASSFYRWLDIVWSRITLRPQNARPQIHGGSRQGARQGEWLVHAHNHEQVHGRVRTVCRCCPGVFVPLYQAANSPERGTILARS